jgi:hypothetical protein
MECVSLRAFAPFIALRLTLHNPQPQFSEDSCSFVG